MIPQYGIDLQVFHDSQRIIPVILFEVIRFDRRVDNTLSFLIIQSTQLFFRRVYSLEEKEMADQINTLPNECKTNGDKDYHETG